MCAGIARAGTIAALMAFASAAANSLLIPGLYQVEVRIVLPNVQNAAAPVVVTQCVSAADLDSGRAFSLLSANPLKNCDLLDYQMTDGAATYRIACPGPNRGRALAAFETTATTYRGSIKMDMGAKNMTMSETQAGKRIGDCH